MHWNWTFGDAFRVEGDVAIQLSKSTVAPADDVQSRYPIDPGEMCGGVATSV